MSSNVTNPSDIKKSANTQTNASPSSKGKEKAMDSKDHDMDEEDEEEEEEEMGSEDEAEEIDDDFAEIDPTAIITQSRRTRGVRVDYTSEEALKKAGLQGHEDEESDDDVEMKD